MDDNTLKVVTAYADEIRNNTKLLQRIEKYIAEIDALNEKLQMIENAVADYEAHKTYNLPATIKVILNDPKPFESEGTANA